MTLQAKQNVANVDQQLLRAQHLYQQSLQVALSNEEVIALRLEITDVANDLLHYSEHRADAYNLLGRTALDEGFIDKAKLYLKKSIELSPNSADYQYSFGHLLLQEGEIHQAIRYFEQAEQHAPGQTRAQSSMAYCYLYLGKPEQAFLIYNQLIKTQPNDDHIKSKLFECCHLIKADFYNPTLANELLGYFSLSGVDYQQLHNLTSSMLLQYFRKHNNLHLDQLTDCHLFVASLEKLLFCNREMEIIIRMVRKQLLIECLQNPDNFKRWHPLITAIAQQGLNNEFIWFIDPEESACLSKLNDSIDQACQSDFDCNFVASILAI